MSQREGSLRADATGMILKLLSCGIILTAALSAPPYVLATAATPLTESSSSGRNRVAIVTGGSRGIGKGIVQALIESGEYQGIIINYNTNQEAAQAFQNELHGSHPAVQVEIVGGDLTQSSSRDSIFECLDAKFGEDASELCLMVHNAGQYAGVTSDNTHGLEAPKGPGQKFGDGTMIDGDTGKVNMEYVHFYHKLYAEAYIDLCERSLARMKKAHAKHPETYRGCLIGISSPGCNHNHRLSPGYDMPGSGKCVMEFANRYLALRAAPFNINANVIIPGFTRSDAWGKIAEKRGSDRDTILEQMKSVVPMGQIVEARELGSVIAFLSSMTGGGRFMTGLSLRVDGGTHLK